MSAAQIHIVDDDQALRTALTRLLSAHGYQVVAYESASAFLERVPDDAAGCILLDVDMPGLTGLQLQEHLARTGSILPIVFLTGNGNIAMSVKAIKAGAEDFLAKPVASEDLLAALERALARYREAAASNHHLLELQRRFGTLSGREREVFELVIQGLLNKQIAFELGNTERTVKAQRQAVMEKLGARSVAELVQMGMQLGVLKKAA
ncbi:response regulator [Massilia sp. TS11]|uniref:response regulator transcription factor n=1 Tax=Massilia sp. TS11 TaxID=2908003 RepID=UPI001EDC0764|nr:response regulator [Massilia sp. TS11]